jgi:hypothetical protein
MRSCWIVVLALRRLGFLRRLYSKQVFNRLIEGDGMKRDGFLARDFLFFVLSHSVLLSLSKGNRHVGMLMVMYTMLTSVYIMCISVQDVSTG